MADFNNEKGDEKRESNGSVAAVDPDAQYGGHEARLALEKKLLWKVDLRMSILIFIYILNYASASISRVFSTD